MNYLPSIEEAIFRYNDAIDHALKVNDFQMAKMLLESKHALLKGKTSRLNRNEEK